jgi:hypothetical protein
MKTDLHKGESREGRNAVKVPNPNKITFNRHCQAESNKMLNEFPD